MLSSYAPLVCGERKAAAAGSLSQHLKEERGTPMSAWGLLFRAHHTLSPSPPSPI
jgi:hypothetical protein